MLPLQFAAMLPALHLELAGHANAMAKYLHAELSKLVYAGVGGMSDLTVPECNAVFLLMPETLHDAVTADEASFFYLWTRDTVRGADAVQVRLMTSWDTTEADIDALCSRFARCADVALQQAKATHASGRDQVV